MQGISHINWKDQRELGGHGKYFYPSVDCGRLNTNKATEQIKWKPTSLR